MLKGCKKNVVYVKNTGSEMFEGAYFIVSDSAPYTKSTENDMLKEANKIISASPVGSYFENADSHHSENRGGRFVWFMLGMVVMASVNALIYFLI